MKSRLSDQCQAGSSSTQNVLEGEREREKKKASNLSKVNTSRSADRVYVLNPFVLIPAFPHLRLTVVYISGIIGVIRLTIPTRIEWTIHVKRHTLWRVQLIRPLRVTPKLPFRARGVPKSLRRTRLMVFRCIHCMADLVLWSFALLFKDEQS